MKNVSDTACSEVQNMYFMLKNFFPPENRAVWDDAEKYCRVGHATDGNIIGRIRFACWIIKVTNTHSEYIPIFFPLQQWLYERASMLRYTYTACLAYRMV